MVGVRSRPAALMSSADILRREDITLDDNSVPSTESAVVSGCFHVARSALRSARDRGDPGESRRRVYSAGGW